MRFADPSAFVAARAELHPNRSCILSRSAVMVHSEFRSALPRGERLAKRKTTAEAIACFALKPGLEQTLRELEIRSDIIKTMHRSMAAAGHEPDVAGFALHGDEPRDPVLGRLVARGLHDELKGSAYAVVEGIDGRTLHLTFSDLGLAGDAARGVIVEARAYEDAKGRKRR